MFCEKFGLIVLQEGARERFQAKFLIYPLAPPSNGFNLKLKQVTFQTKGFHFIYES